MNRMLRSFQNDLREGMTIQEALMKYNMSLEYAFKKLQHKSPKKSRYVPKQKNQTKYIQERNNHFYLRKAIRKKVKPFGTYSSLEDAVKVRDHCMRHGWKQTKIDEYCKELGVVRCTDHRSTVRYH